MRPHAIDWSRWDQLLGSLSDQQLAVKIGCTRLAVFKRRKALGAESCQAARIRSKMTGGRPAVSFRFSEKGEYPSGIYLITCVPTGEQYVGQSGWLCARANGHASSMTIGRHANPRIRDAAARHGASAFAIEPLELCERALLEDREAHWIVLLEPAFNDADAIRRAKKRLKKRQNPLV